MARSHTRRALALFALALALVAALPCAALAGSESCCGAMAKCGDASDSPCAQLAAAPCCEAPQTPVDANSAPSLPGAPLMLCAEIVHDPAALAPAPPVRRPAPAALADHAAIRDVVLRL